MKWSSLPYPCPRCPMPLRLNSSGCAPQRFALLANLRTVQIYNSGESVCNPVRYGVDEGAHVSGRHARWGNPLFRGSTGSRHSSTIATFPKRDYATCACIWYRFGLALSADFSVSTRWEEHTSELQSQSNLVCRLLLE